MSFYIETYGCQSNKADSYIMSDLLIKANFVKSSINKAEFIVVNTCAVKEPTENKIKQRLKELYELYGTDPNKHIVIAGCLPQIAPNYIKVIQRIVPTFAAIIDLDNINEIVDIFQTIRKGEVNLIVKSTKSIDKAEYLIEHPTHKLTGIIPISEGCLGSCAYCCVKNARGPLNCYNPHTIVESAKNQLIQGVKQLYLTSQDCSIYKYGETTLAALIQEIVNIERKFFLRVGMINPSFLLSHLDQLFSIYQQEKVYQFLHLPVQSGSDDVLQRMQRTYTISELIKPIEQLKQKFPSLTISTDIICGFPGETDEDFAQTISFINWLKPEIINISKFGPRPGTKAKEMKQLPSETIKERSIRLSKIHRQSVININKDWLGWEGEILLLKEGSRENQAFGRNYAYKSVFIENYAGEFGTFVKVKIIDVKGYNLYSEII